MSFHLRKKITAKISLFLIFFCVIIIGISFEPKIAQAQPSGSMVPVYDLPNHSKNSITAVSTKGLIAKESFLDNIVNIGAKVMLQSVTNSVVNWINSGFEGSPAFVQDPAGFFTDIADQTAGEYIAGLEIKTGGENSTTTTKVGFLCKPFNISLALKADYKSRGDRTPYCRLSDVLNNVENFTSFTSGNFSRGGWDSWFEITQNDANNPFGAYVSAKIEMDRHVMEALNLKKEDLEIGKGFLSWTECTRHSDTDVDEEGMPKCIDEKIQTPGSVIQEQLNITLGSGQRQLEVADEVNEIVGALVGQLVKTVLTQGLASFSSSGDNYDTLGTPLAVTCVPNQIQASVDEDVVWSASIVGGYGNPANARYSWTWTDNGVISETRATTSVITKRYVTRGIKGASVTVTQDGETVSEDCLAEVLIPEGPTEPPMIVLCSAEPTRANINQPVTWRAEVVATDNNVGDTTFVWRGTEPMNGNTTSGASTTEVHIAYPQEGTKTATVEATRNGQTVSGTCYNSVEINPPLVVSCYPSSDRITRGGGVFWTADVTRGEPGNEEPTFLWTGTSGTPTIVGRTERRPFITYNDIGTKTASVIVSRLTQTTIQSCTPNVTVLPPN